MKQPHQQRKKICIVTSSGGHLIKTWYLKEWWSHYERVWVTRKDEFSLSLLKGEQVVEGFFPENRNVGNFLRNLIVAWRLFTKNRPDVVYSMGAGIAPPFFLVARLLGIKSIFVETFISIPKPTLSGRLIYPLATRFVVQNPKLLSVYPRAEYWGETL